MSEPRAMRPYMPGYGIAASREGMLPWSWALERLTSSHDYWLATTWPSGHPHVMPVWGVWLAGAMWFSTGVRSRKARNLTANPQCVLTTDDAVHPVVVTGTAGQRTEPETIRGFLSALNTKYDTHLGEDFLKPGTNGVFEVPPTVVFALDDESFESSPTRWEFHA